MNWLCHIYGSIIVLILDLIFGIIRMGNLIILVVLITKAVILVTLIFFN